MRSRELSLGILLALALITIATNSAYAAPSGFHTPVSKANPAARVTLAVGSIDAAGNFTQTASVQRSWNGTTGDLQCSLVALASNGDPANSFKCFFGGLSVGGVQIANYSTVVGDGARVVATQSPGRNDLSVKNFVVKNTTSTTLAVQLDVEFTFDDTSNALTRTVTGLEGVGRGHGGNYKVKFFSCQSGSCLAVPTGDRFIGKSEFVYFDDNAPTETSFFESTGGVANAGITVDYTVGGANPADMGTKCFAEGSTSLVCPNNPPFTTKCPTTTPNFGGTCKTVENVFQRTIYKLGPLHRAQVLAGNNATSANEFNDPDTGERIGACVGTQTPQLAESILEGSCRIHANETIGPGQGQTHIEVLGGAVDLQDCDWANATAGLGGSGMVVRQFNFLTLDNRGRKDDVSVSLEGDAGVGPGACGEGARTVDLQIIVTCSVPITCQDAEERQGNNPNRPFDIISSTSGTFNVPLVCTMPAEVTPCPQP